MLSLTNASDRRHAADQLGVPPDAPPADARAAFLRRLPATSFLPAPPLCAAATALIGRPIAGASSADLQLNEGVLHADVAAFARMFWSLAPQNRRLQWPNLLARVSDDQLLAASLRRLEAGIDLPDATAGGGPPRPKEIVGMIQSLFVLGPFDRASRRRELLDALPPPAAGWEQAARNVQHHYPSHAALEPALIERLMTWTRRPKPDPRAVSRPAPTWGFQVQGGLQVPQVRPVTSRQSSAGWTVGLLIAVVVTALRVAVGGNQETRRPQTPAYSIPSKPIGQPWDTGAGRPLPNFPRPSQPTVNHRLGENPALDKILRDIQRENQQTTPTNPVRP
jgi:hypothetical protein